MLRRALCRAGVNASLACSGKRRADHQSIARGIGQPDRSAGFGGEAVRQPRTRGPRLYRSRPPTHQNVPERRVEKDFWPSARTASSMLFAPRSAPTSSRPPLTSASPARSPRFRRSLTAPFGSFSPSTTHPSSTCPRFGKARRAPPSPRRCRFPRRTPRRRQKRGERI